MSIAMQDAVLHGLLNFGADTWTEHGHALREEMFAGERREIFAAIRDSYARAIEPDVLIVAHTVTPEAGGLLDGIMASHASLGAMGSYIARLRKDYTDERMRDLGAMLMDGEDIDSVLAQIQELRSDQVADEFPSSREALSELTNQLAQGGTPGLKTGLIDLDRLIGALRPGNLFILAARPGMGKTALMLNIAQRQDCPVVVFSLEMSRPELVARMVAYYGMDYGKLASGKIAEADWEQYTEATRKVPDTVYINDRGGQSIEQIEAGAYRMVKHHGVGLICVDYLQLIVCRAESRLEAVSEVSRRLKALAKNMNVPVIALSQMNRSVESRSRPIPTMADLRESGQIEQDADQIVFVYRPEVYVRPETEKNAYRPGEADLIVEKNRSGKIGTATVQWVGINQRFRNLSHS